MAVCSPVRAGMEESRAWFTTLSLTERSAIQSDLILLGKYDAFVDGVFGIGTFAGLLAFQKDIGTMDPSGVLAATDLTTLDEHANAIAVGMGFDVVRDERSGLALAVPLKILAKR